MASEYSSLKVIHHQDRLAELKAGKQTAPLQVQLIISDLCNESCSFCAYRLDGYSSNQLFGIIDSTTGEKNNNPARMIPAAKAIEILDDCKELGVKAIQMTGGGEPTVHPEHLRIFQHVLDRGLDLALVSNGTIFRAGLVDILLQAQWVRFSLDAGHAETYGRMRQVGPETFHRVLRNIAGLVAARVNCRDSALVIGTGFVVTRENYKEVYQWTCRARDLGVDNVRLSAFFQSDDERYFADFYEEARDLCQAAAELATPTFTVFNNFGNRMADLALHHPDYSFCGYQQLVTYIGGDLSVYRCCNLAYNERGKLGSLKEQRFKDFWEAEEKKAKIANFNARSCPRCMYNGTNRSILYAIDPAPRHVNFI